MKRALTLLDLLIVVVILSILFVLLIPRFIDNEASAQADAVKTVEIYLGESLPAASVTRNQGDEYLVSVVDENGSTRSWIVFGGHVTEVKDGGSSDEVLLDPEAEEPEDDAPSEKGESTDENE